MNFSRNYAGEEYNGYYENAMYSFISRLYQAIEYMRSKSGHLKIFKIKGKIMKRNNKSYEICGIPRRESME